MSSNFKKCSFCAMDFSSKKDLERHVSDDHVTKFLNSFKTFKCDVCEEKFVNDLLRNLHTVKFHGPFECQRCGKQFTQERFIKCHECRIYWKIWQSSHGRESRYLPGFVRAAFENQSRFLSPEINAVPSQKLDYDLIKEITNFAKQKCESKAKQLHFLCIGDNNLRWNKDTPETFMAKVEQLVKELSDIPNCFLVLASILPQPVSDETSKPVFRQVNRAMYNLSKNNPNVSFMDVTKSFVKDKIIDRKLFQRDGVHMKPLGAEKYANCIKRHAMGLKL